MRKKQKKKEKYGRKVTPAFSALRFRFPCMAALFFCCCKKLIQKKKNKKKNKQNEEKQKQKQKTNGPPQSNFWEADFDWDCWNRVFKGKIMLLCPVYLRSTFSKLIKSCVIVISNQNLTKSIIFLGKQVPL